MRSIIILLLFAVFFLSGMVFGIDKNNRSDIEGINEQAVEEIELEEIETVDEDITYEQAAVITGKEHTVQKVASLLEKAVRAFYELVVQLMYQFTKLFIN